MNPVHAVLRVSKAALLVAAAVVATRPAHAALPFAGDLVQASASGARPRSVIEQRNKTRLLRAYDTVLGRGQFRSAHRFFARDLIQHDPTVENGLAGLIEQVRKRLDTAPVQSITVKHVIADGAYVVVHFHLSATPSNEFSSTAQLGIYRIDQGLVIEHWAMTQPVPAFTANGHSMFSDAYPDAGLPKPASHRTDSFERNVAHLAAPGLCRHHDRR